MFCPVTSTCYLQSNKVFGAAALSMSNGRALSSTSSSIHLDQLDVDTFQTLLSSSKHDHLTTEIVSAMGGIDKILHEYIRLTREYENEELLSQSEMQDISKIIGAAATEHTHSIFDKLYQRAKLMDNTFHFRLEVQIVSVGHHVSFISLTKLIQRSSPTKCTRFDLPSTSVRLTQCGIQYLLINISRTKSCPPCFPNVRC